MNIQQPTPITPLRARMIADMSGRNLGPTSQSGHLRACKRFAAWLGRSPETATPDDVTYFQQYLVESGVSICTRNQTMTGVKFLFRVTLRRHNLVAEIFYLKEPVKVPLVLSRKEIRRILTMAPSLKAKVMLSLAYGCGMRAGKVVRPKVGDIDSPQEIIRIVQSKGCKDRNVMLPSDILGLLREWWVERPAGQDKDLPVPQRVFLPGYRGKHLSARQISLLFKEAAREAELLPVRVLSRLYRHLILEGLAKLHEAGKLRFFGDHADFADKTTFNAFLKPLRKIEWVVYAKEPFAGPCTARQCMFTCMRGGCSRIFIAINASRRDFQQPADPAQRAQRHLPRQELPRQRSRPPHNHDLGHK